MLWFKKANEPIAAKERDVITPAELAVQFDSSIFAQKLASLIDSMSERGGIDSFVDALENKGTLVREALAPDRVTMLDDATFDALLDSVFTARRKLPAGLTQVPMPVVLQALNTVLHGDGELTTRIMSFVDIVPTQDAKVKQAAWNFATEMLHFYAPERYPLMCRWVWDHKAQSGALREFIRANDTMPKIDVAVTPENFEAHRVWLREQLTAQGFYQRLHYMIDWVLAQSYAEYVLGMSSGMGMLGSAFGAKMESIEFIVKLLGVDQVRRKDRLRVKKAVVH